MTREARVLSTERNGEVIAEHTSSAAVGADASDGTQHLLLGEDEAQAFALLDRSLGGT